MVPRVSYIVEYGDRRVYLDAKYDNRLQGGAGFEDCAYLGYEHREILFVKWPMKQRSKWLEIYGWIYGTQSYEKPLGPYQKSNG
jgi:hypothetical protein